MKVIRWFLSLSLGVLLVTASTYVQADVISVNFSSTRNNEAQRNVTGTAGVLDTGNWNNAESDDSGDGSLTDLADLSGSATIAAISWTSNNTWDTGASDDGGSNSLMGTYLDTGNQGLDNGANVDVTGVPYDHYAVLVYFDGDGSNRFGPYAIEGSTEGEIIGNDPVGTWDETFERDFGEDDTGNYLVFTGITEPDFTLTSSATDPGFRAPLNGFQIQATGVPGDFNRDGSVDVADFEILASNFEEGKLWSQGDINFDGDVTLQDFVEFTAAFNSAGGAAAVPEPSSLALLLLGLTAFVLRRWQTRC